MDHGVDFPGGFGLTFVKVIARMPLAQEAVLRITTELLPLTTILTLNIAEALWFARSTKLSWDDMPEHPKQSNDEDLDYLIRLTKALHRLGPQYVLLKGGQLPLTANLEVPESDLDKQVVVNVLYNGTDVSLIKTPYFGKGVPQGADYAVARMFSNARYHDLPKY